MDISNLSLSAMPLMSTIAAVGPDGASGGSPTAGGEADASLGLIGTGDVDGTAAAVGGAGGHGMPGSTAAGATGGTASASSVSVGAGDLIQATADATGGQGGYGGEELDEPNATGRGGDGGIGGATIGTTAVAVDLAADGLASANAKATGGAGGAGYGYTPELSTSGVGGVASATTAAAYGHSAQASVVQTGGAGGIGGAALSASGGSSTLVDAVTGATTGGTLQLAQTAIGGLGGSEITPADGGSASSALTFDDTRNAIAARSVTATSTAVGGAAGSGMEHSFAAGGDASATLALTAAEAVSATAVAQGGQGDAVYVGLIRHVGGGTADAAVSAHSLTGPASATAVAQGGLGAPVGPLDADDVPTAASASATALATGGQEATASATGTGYSGVVSTSATTTRTGLVSAVSATTNTAINALSASISEAGFGGGRMGIDSGNNNYAFASGLPTGVTAPFATLLGSGSQGSRLTEDGGNYEVAPFDGAPRAETFTTVDSFTVDATTPGGELEAELVDAAIFGSGFSSLDFKVNVGGVQVVDDSFTNAAAAHAFFTNDVVDLGPALADGPLVVSFELDLTTSTVGDGFGENFVLGLDDTAPCFAKGTRIETPTGAIAVEDLQVGQPVVTENGPSAIVWIGRRRVDCRLHPEPRTVRPVRIVAGAFGDAVPQRDLVLSPDHAVFAGGVLIPIHKLIDGQAVRQEECATVTYLHVELDRHCILRAEGLPVESYLDTGNRSRFANTPIVTLHPRLEPEEHGGLCAPMVLDGPLVEAVKAGLRVPPGVERQTAG